MTTEWLVRYQCYPPLSRDPVLVADVYDDEGELFDFANDNPDDVIEVLEIERFPLSISDVTDKFVRSSPDAFDLEASRADQRRDEMLEGVR